MSSGFLRFREFMKLLPVKYYVRLKQMYVYHASLLVRSQIFFENSKRGKLWKTRTRFIGEYFYRNLNKISLNDLFSVSGFHKRWIELLPDYIKDEQDMTNLNQLRQDSLSLSPTKDRTNLNPLFGAELSSYDMTLLGIPEVLDHLLAYFARHPERLQQQGIFRRCGSLQEQSQLVLLLGEGCYDAIKMIDDVNVVADVIKKYFNTLATPLISFTLQKSIITNIPSIDLIYSFKQLSRRATSWSSLRSSWSRCLLSTDESCQ